MRAVIQRVGEASVTVAGTVTGRIGAGVLILLGVGGEDTDREARWLAGKVVRLRIFEDDAGKMNRSLLDVGGDALVVSQFTLYGDASKGNRPSFVAAARPEKAVALYEAFCAAVRSEGVPVACGVFGAHMDVRLLNDGPVTIWLES